MCDNVKYIAQGVHAGQAFVMRNPIGTKTSHPRKSWFSFTMEGFGQEPIELRHVSNTDQEHL